MSSYLRSLPKSYSSLPGPCLQLFGSSAWPFPVCAGRAVHGPVIATVTIGSCSSQGDKCRRLRTSLLKSLGIGVLCSQIGHTGHLGSRVCDPRKYLSSLPGEAGQATRPCRDRRHFSRNYQRQSQEAGTKKAVLLQKDLQQGHPVCRYTFRHRRNHSKKIQGSQKSCPQCSILKEHAAIVLDRGTQGGL
jgi:hypothetical protein